MGVWIDVFVFKYIIFVEYEGEFVESLIDFVYCW